MTRKKGVIYAVASAIVVLALWYQWHKHDKKVDATIRSTVLPPEDSARLIVDENHHSIITVRRTSNGGTQTTATFLPKSGASVDVRRDGDVVITSRKAGTEVSPYLGFALGTDIRPRAALGLGLLYIQRWELGGGLLVGSDIHDTRLYLGGTYNAYGNVLVGLGLDNKKTAHLIVALKF